MPLIRAISISRGLRGKGSRKNSVASNHLPRYPRASSDGEALRRSGSRYLSAHPYNFKYGIQQEAHTWRMNGASEREALQTAVAVHESLARHIRRGTWQLQLLLPCLSNPYPKESEYIAINITSIPRLRIRASDHLLICP